jgi:hypothetical protein
MLYPNLISYRNKLGVGSNRTVFVCVISVFELVELKKNSKSFHYIGSYTNLFLSFLQTVITTWRTHKLVRRERH